MFQRLLISLALLFRQLFGPFVELRGHFLRFFRRATQGYQGFGQFYDVHRLKRDALKRYIADSRVTLQRFTHHLTESRGTILMLLMPMRLSGRSCGCVGVVPIFSRTSSPLINFPKVVYCRSRKVGSPWQMKNCEPAESGWLDRAMEMTPRT